MTCPSFESCCMWWLNWCVIGGLTLNFCHYYTPLNKVVGGYSGFTMSVRPSVHPSVEKSYVV